MFIEAVCGAVSAITLGSLYYSSWLIKYEDRKIQEAEYKLNGGPALICSTLSWNATREKYDRCILTDKHHGPHKINNKWVL